MKPINNIRTNHYFRAGSAKQSSNRSNLNSSSTNKNNVTELLNTPVVQEQVLKSNFNTKFVNLISMSNQQMGRIKRNSAKFTNKSIQQLYEENMQLKKNNHRLYEEVMQLRGKFQAKSKKNSQRVKELDLQFQKQLYWGGSKTHLISGIKHQYAKLRKKYQQQSKQLQYLKVSLMQTKLPQCQVQIQVLQVQNKKLSQKLKKIMQNSMKVDNNSKKVMQVMIVEVQQKNKKLQDKLNQTQMQLQKIKEQSAQKQKKIMFLQKLLIEKDSNNYHLAQKFKRQQKVISEVKQKNQQFKFRMKQLNQQHKQAEKIIIAKCQQQKQIIRQQLTKQNTQLLNKIGQLVQDKRQLQVNINKIKMSSSIIGGGSLKYTLQRKKQMMVKKQPKDVTLQVIAATTKFIDLNVTQSVHFYQSESQSNQSQSQSQSQTQSQHHLKPREMKTANKQHSKDSKKMRKIQFTDIQQIADLIKYRMIAANINVEEMKKYFDKSKSNTLSPECMEWEDQHITMLQVKNILKIVPFNLPQNAAHSLARYLIQDCNQQFVYCDLINQNKRQIVKSIIKSLVNEYSLYDSQIELQIQDFKLKYRHSFYSALKTYYPHGKVNKKKFLDVLGSMGLEITEKVSQIILAKVAQKSISLGQLEFDLLQSL